METAQSEDSDAASRIDARYRFLRGRWPTDANTWLTLAMMRAGDRFQIAGAYQATDDGLHAIATDAEKYRAGADLWLTVCGFGGRPTAKGRERQVSALPGLWADVDSKDLGGRDAIEVLAGLDAWGMRPSQVIWSGHGAQAYWLLDQAIDLNDYLGETDGELELAELQGRLRSTTTRFWAWLCEAVGAKLDNVSNLDRVMRLPETFNLKGGGREAVEVVWDEAAERRWRMQDLTGWLDDLGVEVPTSGGGGGGGSKNWSREQIATAYGKQGSLTEAEADRIGSSLLNRYAQYAADGRDWGGGRSGHDWTGFMLAQQLNDYYVPAEAAIELLERYRQACAGFAGARPEDPFPEWWPREKVSSAYSYPPRGPAGVGGTGGNGTGEDGEDDENGDGKPRRDTDHMNARRFAARFGADVRWSLNGAWFVWDGVRWRPDEHLRRMRLVTTLAEEVRASGAGLDEDERKRIARHANRLEMAGGIDACLRLAQKELSVSVEDLDARESVLALPNGYLDLETFELREPDRNELVTRLCPVEYVSGAWSEDWDRFVLEVCDGDHDRVAWLQKWCGYCLTGWTTEDAILVLHGPTGTGKSTFISAIKAALGSELTSGLNPDMVEGKVSHSAEYGFDMIRGARLVTTSELSRGSRMADAFLKRLVGGEAVQARPIYGRPYEYVPSCKLMISTNYVPRTSDPAVHRRLRLLPFTHQPKEVDRQLRSLFATSADTQRAILAWCVEGAKRWVREGLGELDVLREELDRFRAVSDPVLPFLEECTERTEDPTRWVSAQFLYAAYQAWGAENVGKPLKKQAFTSAMEERGWVRGRYQNGPSSWRDLALATGGL